jgi:hypothetical protein
VARACTPRAGLKPTGTGMTAIDALLRWLEALGLASGVARSSVAYAAVSAGHIIGIALLLGPVALADVRLAGGLRQIDGPALLVLRRTAALGAVLAIATGVLLLSSKPFDYAKIWVVYAKLSVVGLALANALVLEWTMYCRLPTAASGRLYPRLAALASLGLWLTAVALGRWIAFV